MYLYPYAYRYPVPTLTSTPTPTHPGLLFSWLFTLVGFLQMAEWAVKKHKGYKKTYDKEYTQLRRKAIVPFVF
ncbi:hypothetical protein EON64_13520 [archaeon]|nr:MAG: hypothetical protein EON64_13520 [archaeon]